MFLLVSFKKPTDFLRSVRSTFSSWKIKCCIITKDAIVPVDAVLTFCIQSLLTYKNYAFATALLAESVTICMIVVLQTPVYF